MSETSFRKIVFEHRNFCTCPVDLSWSNGSNVSSEIIHWSSKKNFFKRHGVCDRF